MSVFDSYVSKSKTKSIFNDYVANREKSRITMSPYAANKYKLLTEEEKNELIKSQEPKKTLVDQSRYNVVGRSFVPVYEEDKPLAKIGKEAVNYGVGTVSRVAEAIPQAMMQTVSNIDKAIKGEKLDWSEKSLRKDILPPAYDEALKKLASKGIGGDIAAQGIDMLINMGLDPTTYVMGGVIDDLAKAGVVGKASKPSTEFVRLAGERQSAMLAKKAGKAAAGTADNVVDDVAKQVSGEPVTVEAGIGKQTPVKNIDDYIRDAQNKVDDLRYQRNEIGTLNTPEIENAEKELLRLQKKKYLPYYKEQLDSLEKTQREMFEQADDITPEFADVSERIKNLKNRITEIEADKVETPKTEPVKVDTGVKAEQPKTGTGRAATPVTEAKQVQTPSAETAAKNGAQEVPADFKPTTSKQQKYVDDFTAKLSDDAKELGRQIADLEAQKAVEKDGQKLLKIDLQLFAAKKKLDKLSKAYSNTLTNTDVIPQEVKNMLDEDDFRYDVLGEAEQTRIARAKIAEDAEGEMKRIQDLSRTEYNQDDINVGMELLHDLSNKADLTDADVANIRKTAKGVSQAGRTEGRGIQAFAKYTRTKEGLIAGTQKVVDKVEDSIKKTNPKLMDKVKKEADNIFSKAKAKGEKPDYEKILSQVKRKYKIPELTDDDIKKIADYMENYKKAAQGSREQKEAWYKAMQIMSSKIPPTGVDKFRGLQRISYLLNPKTILVRNPTGNVIMNVAETIKDLPGAMVDKVTSVIRKSDRTTALPSAGRLKAQLKGAKEGFTEAIKDVKAGVDTSPTVGMLEMPRRDVFSNNWFGGRALNKADKFVGNMLQLGDRPFYQGAYNERISDLLKLNKTKEVTQEMMDMAHDYALERVFQNDSGMAQFFKAVKTPPANAPAGVKAAWGFISNGIIPFSKTPANILNKLLEYSPAGLAKAIGHAGLSKAGKTVFNQKYFVDNIARGLTGTGLAMLGYAMASKGIVKGKTDKDKDVAAFERLMGINSYSIVMDGKSYTFDWAQPIGSVLAAGADAYYSGMNKDNFSEQMGAALQGYGNTFFNQSMMQNLTRFLNTYNPIAGAVNSVTNTANIVTPTLGAQAAKTIDPYVRDTSADTGIGEMANKLLARTPGLSMTLPKKIDTLGQEQKQSQGRGFAARAFEQFISPGYFGDTDKANDTMKKIYEVYKSTDEKGVFPKLAPDSFKSKGETVKLTSDQKREWQKLSGEYYSKKFNARIAGKTAEGKAAALKKLADEAYEYAKKKVSQ